MISGPEGSTLIKNPGFPVPAMNVGCLIGRVATSRAFFIGANLREAVAETLLAIAGQCVARVVSVCRDRATSRQRCRRTRS